jgi:hypothetical protein
MGRLPKSLHDSVRRVLRQAWELDDANKTEKLHCNLAQRLERDGSGVSGPGRIDEILTVTPLGLPKAAAALACLYQRDREFDGHGPACLPQREAMALRLDGNAMDRHAGSGQSFRRLNAQKQLSLLPAALQVHQNKNSTAPLLANLMPLNINLRSNRFAMFSKKPDISLHLSQTRSTNTALVDLMVSGRDRPGQN